MMGKRSEDKPVDTIDTLIGPKTELKGDLIFEGGLRVDGKVRGNISAAGTTNSTLVVSEQGEVDGSVDVAHVVVNGKINGNIRSTGTVEIQTKASIFGDVNYKALKMDMGATVNGNLVSEQAKSDSGRLKTATLQPAKSAAGAGE